MSLSSVKRLGSWGLVGLMSLSVFAEDAPPPLQPEDAAVRLSAIHQWASSSDDQAIDHLLDALGDSAPANREAATQAVLLKSGPSAVSLFAARVTHADLPMRLGSLEALGRTGPMAKHAIPVLSAALGDTLTSVRLATLQTLHRLGPVVITLLPQPVQSLIQDRDPLIRLAVLSLWAKAASNRGWARYPVEALLSKDPVAEVRLGALIALLEGPSDDWSIPMVGVLKDTVATIRLTGYHAIVERKPVGRQLIHQLTLAVGTETDPLMRAAAVQALGVVRESSRPGRGGRSRRAMLGDQTATLIRALDDRDPRVRLEALTAFADSTERKRFVHFFYKTLGDPDPAVRAKSLEALANLESAFPFTRPAILTLARALSDRSESVRLRAIDALGVSERPAAIPWLHLACDDASPTVQLSARAALIQLTQRLRESYGSLQQIDASPPSISEWTLYLTGQGWGGDGISESRDKGARGLHRCGRVGDPAFLSALTTHPSDEVRALAADYLGLHGDPHHLPALLAAAEDRSPLARAAGVWALAAFKDPKAVAAIRARETREASAMVKTIARLAREEQARRFSRRPRAPSKPPPSPSP